MVVRRFTLAGLCLAGLVCSASAVAQVDEPCPNPEGYTLSADALAAVLNEHAKWVRDSRSGTRAILCRFDATSLDLRNFDLRGVDLRLARLSDADFSGARLDGALMEFADLVKAKFRGASMHKANLYKAVLKGADFSDARGVKINLRKADLSDADFTGAHFPGADIGKSKAIEARFDGANLRGATLRRSDLTGASLVDANLTGANMRKSILVDVNLNGTTVAASDFRKAVITRVMATGVDFSGALNLTGAQRRGFRTKGDRPGLATAVPKSRDKPESDNAVANAVRATARAPKAVANPVPRPEARVANMKQSMWPSPQRKIEKDSASEPTEPERIANPASEPPLKDTAQRESVPARETIVKRTAVSEEAAGPAQPEASGSSKEKYYVQIGSYRNKKIGQAAAERFGKRYKDLLRGIGLELQRTEGKRGVWHRLRTGPIFTREGAVEICETFKAAAFSPGCFVVK